MAETYYSQIEQDKYLNEVVFKNYNNGTFVDVGAHDGVTLSNSYFFEKYRHWNGICIEPMPETFNKLRENRPSTLSLNIAIDETEGEADFILNSGYTEMLSGLASKIDNSHLNRINRENNEFGGQSQTIRVQTVPLQNVLDKYQLRHIHYLSVDVEGAELSVLKSINFNTTFIDIVDFEHNYSPIKAEIISFLENKGFVLIPKDFKWDCMMINKYSQFFKNVFP